LVTEKIDLKEDSCFALFEKREDIERCLEPSDKPFELKAQWDKEKSEKKKEGEPVFLFKKKIFLKDDDREMADPVAKDLIYKQALNSVVNSEYPCSVEDAIKLAGFQFQVLYGDHSKTFHIPGFLLPNINSFVPKLLFSQKKPAEWEALILKEHESLAGKSTEDAKSDYLNVVKTWVFYGTTFYPTCKNISKNNNLPSKVIIGINYEGIRLLKQKSKTLISEFLYTEICSWASSLSTFSFEVGNQSETQKYVFETKQGPNIAATIQTYIDILVQILRSGDDDYDDESETGTNQSSE